MSTTSLMPIPHIMIVEDDDRLSRMYEKAMVHLGFRTLRVTQINQAMDNFWRFAPDVIFLDWLLEGQTSDIFLAQLADLALTQIPAILLISGEIPYDQINVWRNMITETFIKPVRFNDLVPVVTDLVEKSQQHDPIQKMVVEEICPGTVRLVWAGQITRKLIQETMCPALPEAKTVIFDVTHLAFRRLAIQQLRFSAEPLLPFLEHMLVVHEPDDFYPIHMLMRLFNMNAEVSYYINSELAEAQALIEHGND